MSWPGLVVGLSSLGLAGAAAVFAYEGQAARRMGKAS